MNQHSAAKELETTGTEKVGEWCLVGMSADLPLEMWAHHGISIVTIAEAKPKFLSESVHDQNLVLSAVIEGFFYLSVH